MLLPIGAWGKEFVAIPFNGVSSNLYQVVAYYNNTVVTNGSTTLATLNSGEYRQFQTEATLITSSQPIELIQLGQVRSFKLIITQPNKAFQNIGDPDHLLGNPFFLQIPST